MSDWESQSLARMLADYGFAMSCLVQEKLEQTGRTEEARQLLARGFRFLFTYSPDRVAVGGLGEVGAALFHPDTRETVPILRFALTGQPTADSARPAAH